MSTSPAVGTVDGASTAAAPTTADLPKMMVTEDGKRMQLVTEETIRYFQSAELGPPLRAYSAEFMREMGLNEDRIAIMLRAFQASREIREMQADVLQQYEARGYAYRQIPQGGYPENMQEQLRLVQKKIEELANSP